MSHLSKCEWKAGLKFPVKVGVTHRKYFTRIRIDSVQQNIFILFFALSCLSRVCFADELMRPLTILQCTFTLDTFQHERGNSHDSVTQENGNNWKWNIMYFAQPSSSSSSSSSSPALTLSVAVIVVWIQSDSSSSQHIDTNVNCVLHLIVSYARGNSEVSSTLTEEIIKQTVHPSCMNICKFTNSLQVLQFSLNTSETLSPLEIVNSWMNWVPAALSICV